MTNEERTSFGLQALRAGCPDHDEDNQTMLADALANLRHAAAWHGLNFERANEMAEIHFNSEVRECTHEVVPLHKSTVQETPTGTRVMVVIDGGICQDVIALTPTEPGFQYVIKDWDDIKEAGEAQDFYDTYKEDTDARIILDGVEAPSKHCTISSDQTSTTR